MVENRTADIIQETRKIQIKKKDHNFDVQNQNANIYRQRQQLPVQTHMQPQTHADLEIQLKASRDVRWHFCGFKLLNYLAKTQLFLSKYN